MDINELRENMNKKSEEELLGMLSRRNLYSPVQIDLAIEILKSRKESPVESHESVNIPEDRDDDPTSLFSPEDVRKIAESAESPAKKEEKRENTEHIPHISEDYISFQKVAKTEKENPVKKKSKAPVIIISVISLLVLIGIALVFIFRPGVGFFISNYEKGNYETAHFFYKWCKGNKNAHTEMTEYFNEQAIIITDDYLDGKITYEAAKKELTHMKMFDVELAEDYLDELKNADKAETLFAEGMRYYDDGEYYDAIKTLSTIYKGYKKYDAVEEALEDSRKLLKNDLEYKMQEWLETHDFENALDYIESIKDAFENDPDIQSYENAIASQLEAVEERNAAAEDFYENGGDASNDFRNESGLTYPSRTIVNWEELGNKVVIEYGPMGSDRFAFAVFSDMGNGMEEIFSYKDALYDIYGGEISTSDGQIVITGKILTSVVAENGEDVEDEYTEVTYTLKYNGEEVYLG